MYIPALYLITVCFAFVIIIKAKDGKPEWILLLVILSFVKTCITYLFNATTIFTVLTIGGIQIHLDDIVLIIALLYCLTNIIYPFYGGKYFLSTLLLLVPLGGSLFRGLILGFIGSEVFLADMRKYFLFVVVLYAVYFCVRTEKAIDRIWKFEHYIDKLMNVVLVYLVIIWMLDVILGINSLPGQKGGMLSDGGSTFRIINPPQVLMIGFYTLYRAYRDLDEKRKLSIRTLLFAVSIIFLQWRTAVAAFGVGIILLFVLSIKKNGISQKLLLEISVLAILIIVVSNQSNREAGLIGMVTNLFESFSNIGKDTGTFATRTDAWSMILASLHGVDVVLGMPFGESLNIEWAYSAHSGYVDYISKMGYLGAICLICFMFYFLAQSIKSKNYICAVLLLTQMTYWIGYGFSLEQGAILGFLLATQEVNQRMGVLGEVYEE
ncbi:MAG: hypothetical protein KH186_00245 [Lachnospiraceae bacterium]|nr:hypothetical protein [Lachnospiraceae bacterium]